MALTYGLGIGLAYRHDFKSEDEFKLRLYEAAERKKEREADRERQARIDAEQAAEKDKVFYPANPVPTYDAYNTNRFNTNQAANIKRLGDIKADPNHDLNPKLLAEADAINAQLINDPAYLESKTTTEQLNLLKKEHDTGIISLEEYNEKKKEYDAYAGQAPDGALKFSYQSRENQFSDMITKNWGQITGFASSAEEQAFTEGVYKDNKAMLDRKWDNLEKTTKDVYGNDKMKWLKSNGRQIMPKYTSPSPKDGKLTEEQTIDNDFRDYFRSKTDGLGTGEDANMRYLIPVTPDGSLDTSLISIPRTVKGIDQQGNPTTTVEWTTIPSFTNISYGIANPEYTRKWIRNKDGVILLEVKIIANPTTGVNSFMGMDKLSADDPDPLNVFAKEENLTIETRSDGKRVFTAYVPADMSNSTNRKRYVDASKGFDLGYGVQVAGENDQYKKE